MRKKKFRLIILVAFIVFVFFKFSILNQILGRNNIIIIDPGHGGKDPGTISIDNIMEKDINLLISQKLSKKLKGMNYKVKMTRNTDEYPENIERANMANKKRARIFISIHCNALENNTTANGVQVLYYPGRKGVNNDPNSDILAQLVLDSLISHTGAKDKGIIEREDLIVLNQTKMPAILVECGFLSNKKEADLLKSEDYQDRIVKGIVDGIDAFLHKNNE